MGTESRQGQRTDEKWHSFMKTEKPEVVDGLGDRLPKVSCQKCNITETVFCRECCRTSVLENTHLRQD